MYEKAVRRMKVRLDGVGRNQLELNEDYVGPSHSGAGIETRLESDTEIKAIPHVQRKCRNSWLNRARLSTLDL